MKYLIDERAMVLADECGRIVYTHSPKQYLELKNYNLYSFKIIGVNENKKKYLIEINDPKIISLKYDTSYENEFHIGDKLKGKKVWYILEEAILGVVGDTCNICYNSFPEIFRDLDKVGRKDFICWSCQK